eukprot:m.17134 g.17134  ORF g.17134 m.17134 type:complete len:263 (+) comp3568_c0_seq1:32-820(+)
MFTTLNDALGWRASPALPDPCTVLLTEDGLDGGFLVHHFLSMHAKGGHPVLLVSFTQALAHYVAACRRLGVNLQSGSAARCLTFVDGVSNLVGLGADVDGALSLDLGAARPLEPLRAAIDSFIAGVSPTSRFCVVLDGLDVLEGLGIALSDILGEVAHCAALAEERGILVLGMAVHDSAAHDDSDDEARTSQALLNELRFRSDLAIRVSPLATGFSRDVHGQLEIEQLSHQPALAPTITKLHFQTSENTVRCFAVGTSSAVL